jgi:hypothetical protein
MSIVIKEIIISDNLEKFMEKVNFNFDQLLLAGGGPPGPQGPIGLEGPAGPQGNPGNKWYVGCTAELNDLIPGTTAVYSGDMFLAQGTAGSFCPGSTWGPLGQVFQYDDTTLQFEDTDINLRGPKGDQGDTGDNVGGDVYPGTASIIASDPWRADSVINIVGPTSNFHLLKGDGLGFDDAGPNIGDLPQVGGVPLPGATVETGMSRDTLWLGGLSSAQSPNIAGQTLDRMPKLFVEPRTIMSFNEPTYISGGIKLGFANLTDHLEGDQNKALLKDLFDSYSNITVDNALNLRITNFTNFNQAVLATNATSENKISIESISSVQLLGRGISIDNSETSIQTGLGLDTLNSIGNASIDRFNTGGTIIATDTDNTSNYINMIYANKNSINSIFGGGSEDVTISTIPQLLPDFDIRYPNLTLGAKQDPTDRPYTITLSSGINLEAGEFNSIFTDVDSNNAPIYARNLSHIRAGQFTGTTQGYIGLGTNIQNVGSSPNYAPSFFVHGNNASLRGNHASIDLTWASNNANGIDLLNLRIRETFTAGTLNESQILTNEDAT